MFNTNITSFRKDIFNVMERTIKYNEPVNISTKDGNAVVLSEEEYRGMLATLELTASIPMKKKLTDGLRTPLGDCVDESRVKW